MTQDLVIQGRNITAVEIGLARDLMMDRSRFKGTCYRAANWLRLGATRGRTRNDRNRRIQAPVKDVYPDPNL
jgi:hypothetical protein